MPKLSQNISCLNWPITTCLAAKRINYWDAAVSRCHCIITATSIRATSAVQKGKDDDDAVAVAVDVAVVAWLCKWVNRKCQCSTGAGTDRPPPSPPLLLPLALDSCRLKATDTHSNLLGLNGEGGGQCVSEGGVQIKSINLYGKVQQQTELRLSAQRHWNLFTRVLRKVARRKQRDSAGERKSKREQEREREEGEGSLAFHTPQ